MEKDIKQLGIGEQVRIKRLMERKSQQEVAKELNINRTYLSLYELGRLSVTDKHKETLIAFING